MTKWVAEFEIPDGHLIGCAYAKTCPNDNKNRKEEDYKDVYATTQRKTDYLRKNLKESNFQRIKRMNREELAAFLYRVELGDVDFPLRFAIYAKRTITENATGKNAQEHGLTLTVKTTRKG